MAYGNREQFLAAFNPGLQGDICGDAEMCFFGGAPTLAQLNATYGSQTAAMWLIPQLYNLSEYCGCKEKLQGRPLEECASVIAAEFRYLSVSELMLFFHRFKSGRYGRFYGSVDPLVITTSLRDFLEERSIEYERHEREEFGRKINQDAKDAVSWEDHSMRKYGEVRPIPFSQKPTAKAKPKEEDTGGFQKNTSKKTRI